MDAWKSYICELLDVSPFMVLATVGEGKSWQNPVYFAYDDHFTFYFISMPTSRHMRNIEGDPSVSCVVFDSSQDASGRVRGFQMSGKARYVEPHQVQHAFDTYFTETQARTPIPTSKGYVSYALPSAEWRLVEVRPDLMQCFDEYVFGSRPERAPEEVFSL